MRFALVHLFFVAQTAMAAAFPPYAPLPSLPAANEGVTHESYGQAEFTLKEKTQVFRGKSWTAHFIYADKWGDDPRVALARYVDALQKAGWSVVMRDDPANPPSATLRYLKDGKDAYVKLEIFEQAAVTMVEIGLPTVKLQLEPPKAGATRVAENADFPFLKRFPGTKLNATAPDDRPLLVQAADDKDPVMVARGTIVKSYQPGPATSTLEVAVAYREALKQAGWQIVSEVTGINQSNHGLTAHYAKGDVDVWVYILAADEIVFAVADAGAERGPGRLKAELDRTCKAAVYGVNFDFGQSTLRPDSEPALNAILKLLAEHPDLAVELGGHTDNVGRRDHNLKLSDARVNAVRGWLVGKGVKAERVTAKGYADTQPADRNDTPEGRAKNRRVELKKARCGAAAA
jgi:OmpA-OmpF porin, OOP family